MKNAAAADVAIEAADLAIEAADIAIKAVSKTSVFTPKRLVVAGVVALAVAGAVVVARVRANKTEEVEETE